ncbi:hypothetical protein GGX14DRAFT_592920 [Mycena pura]|uniref:Uncharacterized protein n=1 Tax=Mycena pura TaxID=153505 RepID=A0AAD6YIJ6_9AGAR|nr:hypothetical protein GGX14DRAFT_592920 [Mycena pura]
MLDTVPQGTCLHVRDFSSRIRNASESDRRAPVVAVDAYKVTEPTDWLLNKSFGKYSHHFILAEIGIEAPLYVRVDFQGDLPLHGESVAHSVILSYDRPSITPGANSFARMSNGNDGGLTLDAFASLLEIMHRRTPYYDVFARNCLWLTECILDATGRRYAEHWRAGHIDPVGLGSYIDGSIGAVTATAKICHNDPAAQFFIEAGLTMLKGVQWLFSLPAGENRVRYPDEEIGEILWEWNSRKDL